MPSLDLIKTFQFEAAHRTPYGGEEACLHGHSYTLDLVIAGELDPDFDWVMDYADITDAFQPIYGRIDHQTLDDLDGIAEPTIQNLEHWVLQQATPLIPALTEVRIAIRGTGAFHPEIIRESEQPHLPDRIRFGFESAHALPKLPPDHKCHTMHGHSFTVEVAAEALETLADDLAHVYDTLDHQCLNEIPGLENPTSEMLSIWIWNTLSQRRSDLHAVLVAETCTARCIYHGG